MERLLLVGMGGFFGASARYILTMLAGRIVQVPLGTLGVNVLGSFGLALLTSCLSTRAAWQPQLRLALGVGFFGAFTTFSTFASESVSLLEEHGLPAFLLHVVLHNGLCIVAVAAGIFIGQRLHSPA